jgi:Flp pilus assembly protein TadG
VPSLCSEPGPRRGARAGESGQALVEFALGATVLILLTVGLVAAGWLLFQYQGLVNGARAGARAASIETALLGPSNCESGSPEPIQAAVAAAAPQLQVETATLCQSAADPAALVQPAPPQGTAAVTVLGTPGLNPSALTQVTVTVALRVVPLPPLPQMSLRLAASSTMAEAGA